MGTIRGDAPSELLYSESRSGKCLESGECFGGDSGFLSSGSIYNTDSDMLLSRGDVEDIAEDTQESTESCSDLKCRRSSAEAYTRLDSGVDVGLSGLSLDQEPMDLKELPTLPSWEEAYAPDEDGDTTLHLAILEQAAASIIQTLLKLAPHPSVLDFQNDSSLTPLHLAVLTRQPGTVRQLVLAGARTDMRDRNGNVPLHLAAASGDLDSVQALTRAIQRTEFSELSYEPFAQPLHPQLTATNYEGLSAAHSAALSNQTQVLRCLHWLGSDLNEPELKGGRSVLHLAAERGYAELAQVLVKDLGCDVNARTYAGHTALELAVGKYPELAEELLGLGAAPPASLHSSIMVLGEESESESEEELL